MAQMEAQQRRPNVVIYSTVINACEKAAKWTQALCLLTAAGTSSVEIDVILCTATMGFWVWSEGGEQFLPFPSLSLSSYLGFGDRIQNTQARRRLFGYQPVCSCLFSRMNQPDGPVWMFGF